MLDALKQLSLNVKKTIEEGISNATIQSEEEVYFRWRIDKFQYTDKGVTESGGHGEYITKPSWFRATIKLGESIKQSREYASALEHLTNVFGESNMLSQNIGYFIRKLIHQFLRDSKFEEEDINQLITTFLKELHGEALKYGAEVKLQGIVLQPDRIEPDSGIILRQTKIEDLEKEQPTYSFMDQRFLSPPSAVLNIELLGRGVGEIQRRIEQAMAILRLFKVGSVKYTSYRMYSESITDLMASGTLTGSEREAALETSLVTQGEVQKLKKFWQTINHLTPQNFFGSGVTKTDYIPIAYERYSDALLQNSILERRIANAMMGLEAIFLKGGGNQELLYHLKVRISKLFGLLGYDPHETKRIIGDAYRVRSLFVHGGYLSYKKKKKLEEKYKNVKNLLLSLLDYLRISIIVMIFSNKEKDEFIDLIDNSLIDSKQEEQLKRDISMAKESIGGEKQPCV